MKKIKYFIIGILLLIVIVVITIVAINMKDRKENPEAYHYIDENTITEEGKELINYRKTLNPVNSPDDFFTVVSCVNQYLGVVNKASLQNMGQSDNEELINSFKINIYNLLDKEYIEKNNVTQDNVYDYVDDINQTVIFFVPLKMKSIASENEETTRYIVYGIEEDINNTYLGYLYIIVNRDNNNNTFSIEPILNGNYNSIDDISLESKVIQINKNENNTVSKVVASDEYVCRNYLDYYKKLILGKPDIAYELLNEEYKQKRFGTYEKFQQYINDNINDFKISQLQQYMVNRNEEYNQYVCKDAYGRIYMFDSSKPMAVSVQLDTYTLETDAFKEQYENGNNEVKVQMNVNKFILMINNQDYETAYNLLDENFKNNYFKTLDDFVLYVRNKAYKYNDFEIKSFNANGNVYMCGANLWDLTGGSYVDATKGTSGGYVYEWTFFVQLGEDKNFTISFGVDNNVIPG